MKEKNGKPTYSLVHNCEADGVLLAPEAFLHQAGGLQGDGDLSHIEDALVDEVNAGGWRHRQVEHGPTRDVLAGSLDAQLGSLEGNKDGVRAVDVVGLRGVGNNLGRSQVHSGPEW